MSEGLMARLTSALQGRYSIERQLGEGGMATVYLASDLKHERRVALKVLKPELAAVVGAERFLAEIKTTANLQHPHILPLFDSGSADGFLFYVMPYVEGESLRERLDRERQLPVDDAVRIATNVAEALDYAHRHGVIHRDIKPANILLQDGKPVVSDFGIALAVSVGGAGRLTETGLSLGTPHYMSPEQATGDGTVGPATDIWAVGCVLYEMLVGEPPYMGSTPQAVLGKILTADPASITGSRHSVPPNVDAAIRKTLEKVPADRFGTGAEFARALGDGGFKHGTPTGPAGRESAAMWKRRTVGATALAAIFAAVAIWGEIDSRSPSQQLVPVAAVLMGPDGEEIGSAGGLVISKDERSVFFGAGGTYFRRDLGELDATAMPTVRAAFMPFVSPDGQWIAYFDAADNWLKRVRLDGTGLQNIVMIPPTSRSGGWSEDGSIIVNSTALGGLARVTPAGELIDSVAPAAGQLAWLSLLPGGRAVVGSQVIDGERRVILVRLDTGESQNLFPGTTPRYAQGRLVYWRDGALWAVPFDVEELRPTGEPALLVQNVVAGDNAFAHFAVSENLLVYRRGGTFSISWGMPVWVDRDGGTAPLGVEPGLYRFPRISPDGRRVAVSRLGANEDIWIHDLASGTSTQLTFDPAADQAPGWTPDGEHIVFRSSRDGAFNLYVVRADGSEDPRRLTTTEVDQTPYDFAPDGSLLFGQANPGTGLDVLSMSLQPGATPTVLLGEPFDERGVSVARGGRFLAYESWELGYPEIFLRAFDAPGGRRLVSTLDVEPANALANADPREARWPLWSRDGTEILYQAGRAFVSVPVRAQDAGSRGSPAVFFEDYARSFSLVGTTARHYDMAPDGSRILLIDTFSPSQATTGNHLVVVQNWIGLLAGRP